MPQLAIDGFPGGLNLSTNIFSGDPFDIPPEDLTVALDLSFLGDRGQLMCRFGDTLLNNALPAGDLAYIYYSPSLDRLIFGGPRSGQAYSYSLGANTLTGLLYNVASGLASPFAFCLCDAPVSGGQGPVYGVVPLNVSPFAKAIYWDGAAASFGTWTASVGTVPIARFYLWAGNRMWAFGEPGAVGGDAANTYYWSELGDPVTGRPRTSTSSTPATATASPPRPRSEPASSSASSISSTRSTISTRAPIARSPSAPAFSTAPLSAARSTRPAADRFTKRLAPRRSASSSLIPTRASSSRTAPASSRWRTAAKSTFSRRSA
jgi:hypothetical protein